MSGRTRTAGWPGGWRFWLISAAAVLGVAATTALGCWQLDRAAQKKALAAAIEARGQQPPLDNQALLPALEQAPQASLVHRPVALQGRWLAQYSIYLDNRQMHGRPGFFVFTPLELALPVQSSVQTRVPQLRDIEQGLFSPPRTEGIAPLYPLFRGSGPSAGSGRSGGGSVVLVQRGWLPRNFQDRTALAPVDSPTGLVTVTGRLALSPARLYEWASGTDPVSEPSLIRQNLDLASYRAETGLPLLGMSMVQTGAASEGLQRDWPRVELGVDKHYGYAFQWFGLSVLIAVLYVWFQFVRRFWRF